MHLSLRHLMGVALCTTTALAFAIPPKHLVTYNQTNVESNAFIADTIPSQYPTKPHSEGKVAWTAVKIACFGHTSPNGKCSALIKMATNTANPIDLGILTIDLNTGLITPTQLKKNGYTLTVTGPARTTITQD